LYFSLTVRHNPPIIPPPILVLGLLSVCGCLMAVIPLTAIPIQASRAIGILLLILDFVAGYLGFSALRSATNSGTALFKLTVLGWQFARISCVLSFSRASMITSKGLLGRSRSLCHRFLVARISHPEFPNHSPQPIRFTALDYLKLSNLLKRGSEYQATDQFVEQEQLQRVRRRGGTSQRHFFCPIRRIAAEPRCHTPSRSSHEASESIHRNIYFTAELSGILFYRIHAFFTSGRSNRLPGLFQ